VHEYRLGDSSWWRLSISSLLRSELIDNFFPLNNIGRTDHYSEFVNAVSFNMVISDIT